MYSFVRYSGSEGTESLAADIVVIGGGGGGLAAARAAVEKGASVIVLEKRGLGGSSAMVFGIFAAGADTGGWETETYFIKLTGYAFGYAINSGRIAGENALEYIKSIAKYSFTLTGRKKNKKFY